MKIKLFILATISILFFVSCSNKYDHTAEEWYNKGETLFQIGINETEFLKEAIKCFDYAIELKPDYYEALKKKGISLDINEEYEEALKYLNKAIKLKSDDNEIWCSKGMVLRKLGKHKEAIKCFNKAIKINPDDVGAWFGKAYSYSILKNREKMLKSLKKAIEIECVFKVISIKDKAFKQYWDDPDFIELTKE